MNTPLHPLLEAATSLPWPALLTITCAALLAALAVVRTGRAALTWLRAIPPERRANLGEHLLVGFFVSVVAGLIMQGLVDFARDDMGLTGPWPYLLFFALDGMAALFATISYRRMAEGGTAPGPRAMVAVITAGSAWFQWEHAAGRELAARVAWAVLPLIAAVLWETILVQRRRAWRNRQTPGENTIPRARWWLAPLQSATMRRRMVLWGVDTYEEAVDLHITRAECIRRLRREYGPFWAWRVPADVAYQLRAGVRIREAAVRVSEILAPRPELVVAEVFADLTPPTVTPSSVGDLPGETIPVTASRALPAPIEEDEELDAEPRRRETWEILTDPDDGPVEPWTDDPWQGDGAWLPRPPSPDPRKARVPAPGTPEFEAVVTAYRESVEAGAPMTGRAICRAAGLTYNHKKFVSKVRDAAQEEQPGRHRQEELLPTP